MKKYYGVVEITINANLNVDADSLEDATAKLKERWRDFPLDITQENVSVVYVGVRPLEDHKSIVHYDDGEFQSEIKGICGATPNGRSSFVAYDNYPNFSYNVVREKLCERCLELWHERRGK